MRNPSISAPLVLSGAGFKRLGPKYLSGNDVSRAVRGDLRPDLELPSFSQAITICNADTDTLYVTTSGPTAASQVLTLTGVGIANETITIGTRVYTLKASVTTTADEILIGATSTATATNICNAINANGLGGYGTDTTQNTQVWASSSGAVVTVTAHVGGTAGNAIASTETLTAGSWGAATLLGGLDNADVDSGIPVTTTTPFTFHYDGDAVPTLFCHCAAANTFTVFFHGD